MSHVSVRTPYNVLVILKTLSPASVDSDGVWWQFAYYLCYINSTLNPLCYALCNQNFRGTYVRILTCRFNQRAPQQGHASRQVRLPPSERPRKQ